MSNLCRNRSVGGARAPSSVRGKGRNKAPSVVLVDDNDQIRELMSLWLSRYGCRIVGEAANGIDAIDCVGLLQPDFVVMDVQMPLMDGVAATKAIRAMHPDVKILGFTSAATDRIEEAGALAAFNKNEFAELARYVAEAGNGHRFTADPSDGRLR